MIEGHVTDNVDPVVEIGLVDGESFLKIPVVVDRGFSGALCLSARYLGDLRFHYVYWRTTELADGTMIREDVFRGEIVFDGEMQSIDFTLTDSFDSLLGAELLKDRTLYIDYPAQTVRIA